MQASNPEEAAITGINVTPLVDIILVVLIIFMATAPMISQRAVKVDVPKARHNERSATEALSVVFNAQRQLLLAGKPVTLDALGKSLAGAVSIQADLRVSLSADKSLPYGEVVAVLDAVRGAGVRKVGLQVVSR